MIKEFVLFVAVLVLVPLGLFLTAFAAVQVFYATQRRADRRQQIKYEQEEWELHVGRERATLLRASGTAAPVVELLHSVDSPDGTNPESLLRIPD